MNKSMELDTFRLLRACIFLCVTVFFLWLVYSGQIYMLVSPLIVHVLLPVTYVLVVITILAFISSFSRDLKPSCGCRPDDTHQHSHAHATAGHNEHAHAHTTLRSPWGRVTIALIAVTAVLAVTWRPQALGSQLLGNGATGSNGGQSITGAASGSSISNPFASQGVGMQGGNQITEASLAQNYAANPSQYIGQKITLEGFVDKPSGLSADHFILTRYFIWCCIADASAAGLTVQSSNISGVKENQWVQVTGVIRTENLPFVASYFPTAWVMGNTVPVLVAQKVQPIATPKLPYLVPS